MLTPTLVTSCTALRPEGVEALRAELIGRGYTPKVAGGEA